MAQRQTWHLTSALKRARIRVAANSLSRQDRIVNFFATFGGGKAMAARQAAPELRCGIEPALERGHSIKRN